MIKSFEQIVFTILYLKKTVAPAAFMFISASEMQCPLLPPTRYHWALCPIFHGNPPTEPNSENATKDMCFNHLL